MAAQDSWPQQLALVDDGRPARRVLFLGNSLTYWNGGVNVVLQKLVPGARAKAIVEGGATLETHWNTLATRAAVEEAARESDVVVLQEDLPETSVAAFTHYAALWIGLVRERGAEPVLYAAWAYARLPLTSDADVAAAHAAVAAAHGVRVAAVGAARAAVGGGVDLFDDDREHPSLAGTYLAACCVAAAIFGPAALAAPRPYRPKNLGAAKAEALRRAAAGAQYKGGS